jgi:hypothetical protein
MMDEANQLNRRRRFALRYCLSLGRHIFLLAEDKWHSCVAFDPDPSIQIFSYFILSAEPTWRGGQDYLSRG